MAFNAVPNAKCAVKTFKLDGKTVSYPYQFSFDQCAGQNHNITADFSCDVMCTQEMKTCPDGTLVSRGYNGTCDFKPCPVVILPEPVCGPANGSVRDSAPAGAELCISGTSSPVLKVVGGWSWNCGMATCSAKEKVNGVCGKNANSCDAGTSGSYDAAKGTWVCNGFYTGNNSSCSIPVDGVCGPSAGKPAITSPFVAVKPAISELELCIKGVPKQSSIRYVKEPDTHDWACGGINGGKDVECHAPIIRKGVCGVISGTNSKIQPASGFCTTGTAFPQPVRDEGTKWTWNCKGDNNGTDSELCFVNKQFDGCGTAANFISIAKPSVNLCLPGSAAGSVNDSGSSWSWSCGGISCSAPKCGGGQNACGNQCVTFGTTDNCKSCGDRCSGGKICSPNGCVCPAGMVDNGGVCIVPPLVVNGACNPDTTPSPTAPSNEGCRSGNFITGQPTNSSWQWSCQGQNGGLSPACSKPKSMYTLSVAKTGTGSGTISTSNGAISCGAACSYSFYTGTAVTLSATTSDKFNAWTSCDSPSGTTCTVVMNRNKNVAVEFVRKTATYGNSQRWRNSFSVNANRVGRFTG